MTEPTQYRDLPQAILHYVNGIRGAIGHQHYQFSLQWLEDGPESYPPIIHVTIQDLKAQGEGWDAASQAVIKRFEEYTGEDRMKFGEGIPDYAEGKYRFSLSGMFVNYAVNAASHEGKVAKDQGLGIRD